MTTLQHLIQPRWIDKADKVSVISLVQSRDLEANPMPPSQLAQDGCESHEKTCSLSAFDNSVIANHGSLDRSDKAETNIVPEFRILTQGQQILIVCCICPL